LTAIASTAINGYSSFVPVEDVKPSNPQSVKIVSSVGNHLKDKEEKYDIKTV